MANFKFTIYYYNSYNHPNSHLLNLYQNFHLSQNTYPISKANSASLPNHYPSMVYKFQAQKFACQNRSSLLNSFVICQDFSNGQLIADLH